MPSSDRKVPLTLLAQLAEAIQSLRYGVIHITVQDSHVVQIEKVEKIRLETSQEADLTPGGSQETGARTDRTTGGARIFAARRERLTGP